MTRHYLQGDAYRESIKDIVGRYHTQRPDQLHWIGTSTYFNAEDGTYITANALKQESGTWDIQVLKGRSQQGVASGPEGTIDSNLTQTQAIAGLEKFDAEQEQAGLAKCDGDSTGHPHHSKVTAALKGETLIPQGKTAPKL